MVIESSCCTLIDLGNGSNRQATILSSPNPIHKLFYFRLHVIGVTWKLQPSSVENIKTW